MINLSQNTSVWCKSCTKFIVYLKCLIILFETQISLSTKNVSVTLFMVQVNLCTIFNMETVQCVHNNFPNQFWRFLLNKFPN